MENKWAEIVNNNEKVIKKAMQSANWDALRNKHMRFVVCVNEDGYVWTLEDVAGGNSFSASVFEGTAIELREYCYQYEEGNPAMEQKYYKEDCLDDDFDCILENLQEKYGE